MDAKLSGHQRKQSLRVANVPEEVFERAVEAERPATVTQLAEMGKRARAARLRQFPEALAGWAGQAKAICVDML